VNRKTILTVCCGFLIIASDFALAIETSPFIGKVVRISDGDTVFILNGNRTFKIRLANIDAPEKNQSYGLACKRRLSERVFQKEVRVNPVVKNSLDRYNRTVATINLGETDINLEQIKSGCAWHYTEYARRAQDKTNFMVYKTAENRARLDRIGLWQDLNPVYPPKFRKAQKRRF